MLCLRPGKMHCTSAWRAKASYIEVVAQRNANAIETRDVVGGGGGYMRSSRFHSPRARAAAASWKLPEQMQNDADRKLRRVADAVWVLSVCWKNKDE